MSGVFWNTFRIALEAPFVCFHLSINTCIVVQARRGNAFFQSGFFALYVAQSTADLINYFLSIVLIRLPRCGIVLSSVVIYPFGNIGFTLMGYSVFFQFVAHMAIAVNRYCVIEGKSEGIWNGTKLKGILCMLLLLPIPPSAPRMLGEVIILNFGVPGVYSVIVRGAPTIIAIGTAATVLYSLVTCLVSVVLELATLLAYRRLKSSVRQRHSQDYKLLLYALLQLVSQVLVAAYYSILGLATIANNQQLVAFIQSTNPYLVEVLCLSSPICLFTTSSVLRQAYKRMYGCGVAYRNANSSVIVVTTNSSPLTRRSRRS